MSKTPSRKKRILTRVLLPATAIGALTWFLWPASAEESTQESSEEALTAKVESKPFVQEVSEKGEVESSSNVEIRCEVDTGSAGIAILEIVPEGTYVEEGDFLVRLDDADLQSRLVTRQIDLNGSRASLAQARADLEGARLALEEYKSGTFREQEEQMVSEVFVSEENLRRAQEYLRYSRGLAEKGYVSDVQLEADQFAVEKAERELEVSRTKLEVLRTYTKQKMITQLEADIVTGEAKLSAAERAHQIDEEQLHDVEEQISLCTINAPTSGQVIYANNVSSTDEILIEEGKQVRERQQIIRLPDPRRMQVLAEVNESRIDLLDEGMFTRITVDALPDLELTGALERMTEYPLRAKNSYVRHIKNYGVTIAIQNPPEGLKPGMTAEVSIKVEDRDEALQVPVSSVIEREERYFCLVQEENSLHAAPVEIGSANDNFVVIESGLREDQDVILSPETWIDSVELPQPLVANATPPKRRTTNRRG